VLILLFLIVVATYGSIVFAGGAALYWLAKERFIMGLTLAAFAAYCAYELHLLFQQDPGKQVTGLVWASVRGWLGLALAVAVGGVGEFVRDRIVGRRIS